MTDAELMCLHCGIKPVCEADDYQEHCAECFAVAQQNRDEAAYERWLENECFRGGEAAAFSAEQQARIQRELK